MIKTCEFVSKDHPDKIADRISDSILDFCVKGDPLSRVACEVMGGHGKVFITGEITTNAELTNDVIKGIVKEICGVEDVTINLVQQSRFIAQGVDIGGASDQGIMVGYATNKTKSHMPVEYELARDLCNFIYKKHPYDGKTQVTIEEGRDSFVIKSIVASFQNTKKEELEEDIIDFLKKEKLDDKYPTELYCNMAGDWTQGGFEADTGLTGRKLVVDNYGPQACLGGGCFSGKDSTKVDRSGAYMARKIALELLKKHEAGEAMVKISYCIGKAEPTMVSANIDGLEYDYTEEYSERCKPQNIIKELDLRKPIFAKTAESGHFGNKSFEWEKVD